MTKLSSDRYSWVITTSDNSGVTVELTDSVKHRVKQFTQRGVVTTDRMNDHFNSLTDELCDAFWPKERKPKPDKQVQ